MKNSGTLRLRQSHPSNLDALLTVGMPFAKSHWIITTLQPTMKNKVTHTLVSFTTVVSALNFIAGLCLAGMFLLSVPARAADEPYLPTKDTGPHNPLEPKRTPDNGSSIGLMIIGGVALLAGRRLMISRTNGQRCDER